MGISQIRLRNLEGLLERVGKKAEFARRVGTDPSYISQITSPKTRRNVGEDLARQIEKSLHLPGGWMDREHENFDVIVKSEDGSIHIVEAKTYPQVRDNADELPAKVYQVPLISWVQAGEWQNIEDPFSVAEEWRYTTAKVGWNAFALRVKGDSMENPRGRPSYPDGSIIVVDPAQEPLSGKRVVAKLLDTDEATFKVYVEDAGKHYLKPLNPQYPTLPINGNAIICGVVVQTIIDE